MQALSETCERALLAPTVPIARFCNTSHLTVFALHPLLKTLQMILSSDACGGPFAALATDHGSCNAQVWKYACMKLYFTLVLVTSS